MPRYFFDIHANGNCTLDEVGTECASPDGARMAAMETLPAIAKDEVSADGDRQAYTVMVKDEVGQPVYSATLTFAGLWLGDN